MQSSISPYHVILGRRQRKLGSLVDQVAAVSDQLMPQILTNVEFLQQHLYKNGVTVLDFRTGKETKFESGVPKVDDPQPSTSCDCDAGQTTDSNTEDDSDDSSQDFTPEKPIALKRPRIASTPKEGGKGNLNFCF